MLQKNVENYQTNIIIKIMNKEEILTSVYNMIYEQNTTDKKECLLLAEEITEFIEELIDNQSNKNKDE